jgi:hypothetical protein
MFKNPALANSLQGGLNNNTFIRVMTQLAASGNEESRRRVREHRQSQARKFNPSMQVVSPYLNAINRERLSLATPGLREALKPVIERERGNFRFGNSGYPSANTNSILNRLRKAVNNRKVSNLVNELKNENTNVNGQTIKKNRLLQIEIDGALRQLSYYLGALGNNRNHQKRSKLIRAFIARYGDLTSNDIKIIKRNVNSSNLRTYLTTRRIYKNGTSREPSRRLRELPAYRTGLGPATERRLRSTKKPSNYSRR